MVQYLYLSDEEMQLSVNDILNMVKIFDFYRKFQFNKYKPVLSGKMYRNQDY
jgi:hypothetical protein